MATCYIILIVSPLCEAKDTLCIQNGAFCIFFFDISLKKVWKFCYLLFFTRLSFCEYVLTNTCTGINFPEIDQSSRNSRKLLLLRYFEVNKITFCLQELWSFILHITLLACGHHFVQYGFYNSTFSHFFFVKLSFRLSVFCFLRVCIFHFSFFCSMLWIWCHLRKLKNICIINDVLFHFVLALYKQCVKT